MDAVTVELLALSFELSSQVLGHIQEQRSTDPQAAATLLETAATRLAEEARTASRRSGGGLEPDALEALRVRTRDLSMVVRMRRPGDAPVHARHLAEAVDAAHHLLEEGNARWLGLWLAGRAVVTAAGLYAGTASATDLATLEEDVQRARAHVLDSVKPHLLASPEVPWRELAAFVRGEGTALLQRLVASDAEVGAMRAPAPPARLEDPGSRWEPPSLETLTLRAESLLKGGMSVYVAPMIPEKKARGARTTMLKDVPADEPLIALIDTTVFGGAENGLAFLGERLFYRDIGKEPVWLPYSAIVSVRAEGDFVLVETPQRAEASDQAPDLRFGAVMRLHVLDADRALRVAGFLQAVRSA